MNESDEFQLTVPPDPHTLAIEHIDFRIDELRDHRFHLRQARDDVANMVALGSDLHDALAQQDQRIKQIDDLIAHFKDSRTVLQRAQHPSGRIDPKDTHTV